jgi:uncharacterized membrane protein YjdF
MKLFGVMVTMDSNDPASASLWRKLLPIRVLLFYILCVILCFIIFVHISARYELTNKVNKLLILSIGVQIIGSTFVLKDAAIDLINHLFSDGWIKRTLFKDETEQIADAKEFEKACYTTALSVLIFAPASLIIIAFLFLWLDNHYGVLH